MTPKEKAIELRNKFRLPNGTYFNDDGDEINHYKIYKNEAKECALILADEMINYVIKWDKENEMEFNEDGGHVEYWNEVKQEIQKL